MKGRGRLKAGGRTLGKIVRLSRRQEGSENSEELFHDQRNKAWHAGGRGIFSQVDRKIWRRKKGPRLMRGQGRDFLPTTEGKTPDSKGMPRKKINPSEARN